MWGSKERERERERNSGGAVYGTWDERGGISLSCVTSRSLFLSRSKNAFVNVIQQRHGQVAKIFFLSRRQQKNKISKGWKSGGMYVIDNQREAFPCYTFFWLVSLLVNSFSFFKLSSHSSVLAERQHKRKIGRDFPILFCFVSPSVQTHTDVPVVEAKWKKKKSCTTFSKGGRWYAPHFCLTHTHTNTHIFW